MEPHVGRLGPDRHVRRDAVRRLAHEVPLQGPLPDDGPRRRRPDRRLGARRVPHDRPRAGDRLREGRTAARSRCRASARATAATSCGSSRSGSSRSAPCASAETFRATMATSPFTFNIAYADDRDIAMYSAGRLPVRHPRVDPRLPDQGHRRSTSGAASSRTRSTRTRRTRRAGMLVNWNNRPAPGWGAADDNWELRLRPARADAARRTSPSATSTTSRRSPAAMNAAATQDLRSRRADAGAAVSCCARRRRRARGRRGCSNCWWRGARRARAGSTATSTA